MNWPTALRRIAAYFIDYLVIAAFIGVLTFVSLSLRQGEPGIPYELADKARAHLVAFLSLTLPVWLYFTGFESAPRGATLGKRVTGLSVKSYLQQPLTFGRAGLRNFIKFLPWEIAHGAIWYVPGRPFLDPMPPLNLTICLLCIAACLFYPGSLFIGEGRTPYDRASGTRVVLNPQ